MIKRIIAMVLCSIMCVGAASAMGTAEDSWEIDAKKRAEIKEEEAGKKEAIAEVADTVFGCDFSGYDYASIYDLWTDETLSDDLTALRRILIDVNIEAEEGEFLPLGFFYKDDLAYTIVEQKDASLALTEYRIHPDIAAAMSVPGEDTFFDTPIYEVVGVELANAERSLIDRMYQ